MYLWKMLMEMMKASHVPIHCLELMMVVWHQNRVTERNTLCHRMNGARPYEIGADMAYDSILESKPGNQQLLSNGKRTTDFLSIPIKRIRTAARQRVVSPFPAGASGVLGPINSQIKHTLLVETQTLVKMIKVHYMEGHFPGRMQI